MKLFSKLKSFISKIGSAFSKKLREILYNKEDEQILSKLEQLFFEADLGATTANKLAKLATEELKKGAEIDQIIKSLQNELLKILGPNVEDKIEASPHIILLVGANGSGKTTSAAKLTQHYKNQNKKVLLVAADTFRAAATEQLSFWSEKLGVDIVKKERGADPAAVVYDGLQKAKDYDVVLVDTAGRLHTKTDLMGELQKILKICGKLIPGAPHETLLILDGTIGQSALTQVETFNKMVPISSIMITKLDSSAKGGVCIALKSEHDISIKWTGIGEGLDDLTLFDSTTFVKELFQ